jgi:hypothetical protein
MSTTFITSLDDEITTQDQRGNASRATPKLSSVVRAIRRKLSPDLVLAQNSSDILKSLPTNVQRPQVKLALEKKQSLDLSKTDLHDAIRGSIRTLGSAVPLGKNSADPVITISLSRARAVLFHQRLVNRNMTLLSPS